MMICDFTYSYADAAEAGIKKALATGAKAPLLFFNVARFAQAGLVAVLGAMKALYVPIEMREDVPEKALKATKLGVFGDASKIGSKLDLAKALEMGRIVSRDIGGSDPERMAAPR
jgi:leucyl aminopeptidase